MPRALRARLHHVDRLRMAVVGDEERSPCPSLALAPRSHRHRLGRGGAFVEQRRVGDLQPGEVDDHRLEVQQRLEPSLRDLRLVRRVRRVPARILEDVALDHRRREAVVSSPARGTSGRSGSSARCARRLVERLVLAQRRREWRAAARSRMPAGTVASISASSDVVAQDARASAATSASRRTDVARNEARRVGGGHFLTLVRHGVL